MVDAGSGRVAGLERVGTLAGRNHLHKEVVDVGIAVGTHISYTGKGDVAARIGVTVERNLIEVPYTGGSGNGIDRNKSVHIGGVSASTYSHTVSIAAV